MKEQVNKSKDAFSIGLVISYIILLSADLTLIFLKIFGVISWEWIVVLSMTWFVPVFHITFVLVRAIHNKLKDK